MLIKKEKEKKKYEESSVGIHFFENNTETR